MFDDVSLVEHGRRQEGRQRNDVGLDLLCLGNELTGLDVNAHVIYLKAVGREHRANQ